MSATITGILWAHASTITFPKGSCLEGQTSIDETFKNLEILDVGCGGGLLSEPFSRLGAYVTGIDASLQNIEIAKIHAKKNGLKIKYLNTSPEKQQINEKFDVILNLEVVEHVANLDLFFRSTTNLLKKNGIMFVATINRTFESYIKAIVGAEYVLRWLPIGTHDWQKFLKPSEVLIENCLNAAETYTLLSNRLFIIAGIL